MLTRDSGRLIARLACFLPLLIGPVATTWLSTLPPVQRRLARGFEDPSVALISGRSLWTDDDLRSLKTAFILRMPAAKATLVMGGSRALPIAAEWFAPRSLFNAALPGGGLDEMIATFQLCLDTGRVPQTVLLEVNPPLAHGRIPDDMRALAPYYLKALARYGVLPPRKSIPDVLSRFRLNPWPIVAPGWGLTQEWIPGKTFVRTDGSGHLSIEPAPASEPEVDVLVARNLLNLDTEYRHWRATSNPEPWDLEVFRRFLDDLQSRGIGVTFFFAPVNPLAYDFYRKLGGYDETGLRREAAARGIEVIGSYSPFVVGAAKADFWDDVHARPGILRRLLEQGGATAPLTPSAAMAPQAMRRSGRDRSE